MLDEATYSFRVTDLKQYVYCPRIFYYQTVLPQVRPVTYKMEAGIATHRQVEGQEKRRSLRTYGLQAGQRSFNVHLYAADLALSGELDMLIETETELVPVDYKAADREGEHYRIQLLAYARLLTATRPGSNKAVRRGFLYLIPLRQAVEVPFTAALQRKLTRSLADMQTVVMAQRMPAATPKQNRCVDCEFRRFCNDVL